MHERDILARQLENVPEHLVLGAVRVEHRVSQEEGRPIEGAVLWHRHLGGEGLDGEGHRLAEREGGEHLLEVSGGGRLVRREGEGRLVELSEVDAVFVAAREHLLNSRARRRRDGDGVEEGRVGGLAAELREARLEDRRRLLAVLGDGGEALRPVVHSVERRYVGKQRLCGAHVGGGLVAPNVLLTGLHGHPVRGLAVRID